METQEILASDLQDTMSETRTNSHEYQVTDCQVSNTSSPQFEFLPGTNPTTLL